MGHTERDDVLTEAAVLIDSLTPLAIEYQSYVRSPETPLDSNETNLDARLRVAHDYDKLTPLVTVRKLEMAGYDEAAAALDEFWKAVFNVVGGLEMSWDDDESDVLDIDVRAMQEKALHELKRARAMGTDEPENSVATTEHTRRIALLTDAALMADTLQSMGLDYQSFLEGCIPIPINEDESEEDRMRRVASEYDKLAPDSVVHNLQRQGFRDAAAALDDLSKTVSQVVHLKDIKPGVDDAEVLEIDVNAKHEKAIDQLKRARGGKAT